MTAECGAGVSRSHALESHPRPAVLQPGKVTEDLAFPGAAFLALHVHRVQDGQFRPELLQGKLGQSAVGEKRFHFHVFKLQLESGFPG